MNSFEDPKHERLYKLLRVLSSDSFNLKKVLKRNDVPMASNTSYAPKDDPYDGFYRAAQFCTGLIGYPVAGTLGIVGSILCIVILNRKNMRTSTNTYLTALAVADLFKLLNDFMYFPTMVLHYHGYYNIFQLLYSFYYPYAFFFSQYSAGNAAWLTVTVAMERFLMVVHPTWSRHALTIMKARVISLIVCFINLCFNIPFMLRFRTVYQCQAQPENNFTYHTNTSVSQACMFDVNTTHFWNSMTHQHAYTIFHGCMRSIIPLLILTLLNARIVYAVRETRANKQLASRNRVTMMLIIVICCSIFLATPDAIMTLMGYGYADETSSFRKGVREITDLLLTINSAVNFYLYMALNRIFLQNFLQLCPIKEDCFAFYEQPQCTGRVETDGEHKRTSNGTWMRSTSFMHTRSTCATYRSRLSVSQTRASIIPSSFNSDIGGTSSDMFQVGKRLSNAVGADLVPLLALQRKSSGFVMYANHDYECESSMTTYSNNLLTVPGSNRTSFLAASHESSNSSAHAFREEASSSLLLATEGVETEEFLPPKLKKLKAPVKLLVPPRRSYSSHRRQQMSIPIITLEEVSD